MLNKSAAPVELDALAEIHNLPQLQEAGFFGRSRELWQIERAFVQGARRITITGFGGQGKTYLAVEAGLWALQTGQFELICFVDYAAFQGVDAVGTVLSTLGTVVGQSLPDSQAATVALQQTATLLILDNLESLNAAALNELLTAAQPWSEAGDSRVLATTRSADLPHPAFPKEGSRKHRYLPLQGLGQEDALAYFQTLQKLPPEPQFKQPAREVLLGLFAQVDFHPLSIALLARELKFRGPADLGERLQALLNAIPPGHENKTLLASLQLSLDRLDQQARLLIRHLGVFQSGASENMILAITEISADEWASLRPALESSGLIQVEDLSHLGVISPYVKFHPTLAPALWQELGPEKLQALAARYRQAYYRLSVFLYYEDRTNPHAARAIALRELPNLLHTVYAALQVGEDFAVAFVHSVNRFLTIFGLTRDRAALTAAQQQAGGDIGSETWYLVSSDQGQHLLEAGEYRQAAVVFQEIVCYLPETPNYNLCITLNRLGCCFAKLGKTADAITCYQQGLALAGQLKNSTAVQRQISILHGDLADAFRHNGDYTEAESHYQQALAIAMETGDALVEAVTQGQLGNLAMVQGDLGLAEQHHQSALTMFQSLNEPQTEAAAWNQLGSVYREAKAWTQAEQSYRKAARITEALGNLVDTAGIWNNLALVTQAQGKLDVAEDWYRKAITVQRQGNPLDLASSLNNLANLLQNQALRLSEAKALAEEALVIRKTLDEASAEIWKTYHILAQITDKQQDPTAAKSYRKLSLDSYLRFAGMPYQMQHHAPLITAVVQVLDSQGTGLPDKVSPLFGKFAASKEVLVLQECISQYLEHWQNLVTAIGQLLNGERNPEVLLEPLGFTDAAIIHCILKALDQP
ncbi:MAG: tetratricopeptide repeat protein [Methylobacter sp.]